MEKYIKNHTKLVFYIAMALLCLFLSCLATTYDYDFFARIIVGERFIEHAILPYQDFLSYTPTHNWYDHEWGSGVIFYSILKIFGPIGLIYLKAIVMFFTGFFVLQTQKLQKHSYPYSIIFMSMFFCLYFVLNNNLVRCQIFSFLLYSIFLYILEGTRCNKFKNLIWIFPLLVIIWNNLHGGVVSGLGLIFIYLIGSIFEKKEWKKYLAVLITSAICLIINPYGIQYLNFLFSATTMHRKYIIEWWPFYKKPHITNFLLPSLFCIFGTISALLNKKKLNITKLIVIVSTLYLGLAHVKLLSIVLISICSLCYNDIFKMFIKFKKNLKVIEKCVLIAILIISITIPLYSPKSPRCDARKFPYTEIEFLKINNFKGNIVVPFGYGSYASYKLYPDMKIFMDGRYEEVYNEKEFNALKQFENVEINWDDILTQYPTEVLMIHENSDIYNFMLKNKNWELIYNGKLCGIFIKKENKKSEYIKPNMSFEYYKNNIFKHGEFIND